MKADHRPFHHAPLLAAAGLLWVSSLADAAPQDWPQWRGPNRDNVSKETGWSAVGRIEPLWRADVGMGYSSPAIAAGRLFIAGYFGDEETPGEGVDRVTCLDVETGVELWSITYPARAYDNEHAGGALSTPTVLAGVVFVPTRAGEVRALSVEDGSTKWLVDLVERHQVNPGRYGFASSPFAQGAGIVLNAGRTVALDRETGDTVWISDDYDANYSTVAPIRLGERACLAVFGGKGLIVVDATNGQHVHTFVFRKSPRNVEGATPIVIGQTIFVSTGYEQGGTLVDFSGDEPELLWRTRRMRNKMAGCTLYDGHFYGFDESMLKCMDLEGNELWYKRGLGHGALTIADGRLLVTTSRGELIVARASPEGFREESRRDVIDDGVFWTAPILAGGRVYVRGSLGDLVCLDHRAAGAASAATVGVRPKTAADTQDLPDAAVLEKQHLAAMGLEAGQIVAFRMTGRLEAKALGLADVEAMWECGEGGLYHAHMGLPPAMPGFIDRYFDGSVGWIENPFQGESLIQGAELAELKRTSGFQSLFDPVPAGLAAKTVARESFRGKACFRVDLTLAPEIVRHVYFDVKTGLYAGRAGDEESTMVFADWRKVEGRLLPFRRTMFEADSGGEARWLFEEVVFEAPDPDAFVIPEKLLEELEKAEEAEGESGQG